MSIRIAVSIFVTTILSGCMSPKLVKHYSNFDNEEKDPVATIEVNSGEDAPSTDDVAAGDKYYVSAFVTPVPKKNSSPFILSLSSEGQASVLAELGKLNQTTDSFSKSIFELGASPSGCAQNDPLRFERRVVFSLAGRHKNPATRFESVIYRIQVSSPPSDPAPSSAIKASSNPANDHNYIKFISWNRFETFSETTALGTTAYRQSQSIGLTDFSSDTNSVSAVAGSIPGRQLVDSLTLNASSSREMTENVTSTRRHAPYTNSLLPRQAVIVHQGAVGVDLFGNFAADFTVELDESNTTSESHLLISGLFSQDGSAQRDETKIRATICGKRRAIHSNAVTAELFVSAVLRIATSGGDTVIEGDDTVRYDLIKQSTGEPIKFLLDSDLSRDVYRIGRQKPDGTTEFLDILTQGKNQQGLLISSYEEADSLNRWLRETKRDSIKGIAFSWPGVRKYDGIHARELDVYLCKDLIAAQCAVVWP